MFIRTPASDDVGRILSTPKNEDDCGARPSSPLDWHYARKTRFDKHARGP
jgi:hypothetical protein